MKINPRIKVWLAKYTIRVNVIFMVGFFLSMSWAYASYLTKKEQYPNIPWYGIFFQVKANPSWASATPFNS